MLGFILNTVKSFVVQNHGQKKWEELLAAAGHAGLDFQGHVPYDEKILYDLATTASRMLNVPLNDVIEAVGVHFASFIKGTPYAKMVAIAGQKFSDLLKNLNALHVHMVGSHFKAMKSPQFRVLMDGESKAIFFYTPGTKERVGLAPLVVGLLKGMASLYFGITTVNVQLVKTLEDGTCEFSLSWDDDSEDNSDDTVNEPDKYTYGFPPSALAQAFPFHFVADFAMKIVQVGPSLQKIVPIETGSKIGDYFSAVQPVDLDFSKLKRIRSVAEHSTFVVLAHMPELDPTQVVKDPITLRGEFIYSKSKKLIYFVGSPAIGSIEAATRMGLSLADFAVHDSTKDVIFMTDAHDMSALEERSRARSGAAPRRPMRKAVSPKPALQLDKLNNGTGGNSSMAAAVATENLAALDAENGAASIESVVRYIFTQKLNVSIASAEEMFMRCINLFKDNMILTLSHLLKLPLTMLERLKLPLLIEAEILKIVQAPETFLDKSAQKPPVLKRASGQFNFDVEAAFGRASGPTTPRAERSPTLFGLTEEMRNTIKNHWNEITQRTAGSLLNQFFDHVLKELAQHDAHAGSLFDGQSLREQSDTIMGLMGYLIRAIEDPVKSIISLKNVAVRFLILGFDRNRFRSLAAAIASAIEKTLGTEKVSPIAKEGWFSFARSSFDLFLNEFESLKTGISGRMWKMVEKGKWKQCFSNILPDRMVLWRDAAMTDKKDEVSLSSAVEIDTYLYELPGQPTPYVFIIETQSGNKMFLCAETELALSQYIQDLTRRAKTWNVVNQRKIGK